MSATGSKTPIGPEDGRIIRFGDLRMNYKVGPDRTASGTAVHEWELGPKRLASPPHKHEHEDEIFYVLEGEVTVMQEDEISQAGAGSYVILPRGQSHTFWNATEKPARLLVILAAGQLEGYFQAASELIRPGQPPDLAQLGQLVEQYGLTLEFERVPELLMKYGLESDMPLPPGGGPANDKPEGVATAR